MSLLLAATSLPSAFPSPPPSSSSSSNHLSKTSSVILKINPAILHFNPLKLLSVASSRNGFAGNHPVYVYPDPDPEFAEVETKKFEDELRVKLVKSKDTFGNDLDAVVEVCAEIFGEFLTKEYGGPGTLLVEPFTDMLLALKEKKLPGAPDAARAAILWAQTYVDQDWEIWTSQRSQEQH